MDKFEKSGALWLPSRRDVLKIGVGLIATRRVAHAANFSLVAHSSLAAWGGSNIPSTPINSTGANILLVAVSSVAGDASHAFIADTLGNLGTTYVQVGSTFTSGGSVVSLWAMQGGTFGVGHSVKTQGASVFGAVAVLAFSGAAATPLDQNVGATAGAGSTTISPGSVTPTRTNELVIAAMAYGNAGATSSTLSLPTPGGLSIVENVPCVQFGNMGLVVAYGIQTTPAASAPVFGSSAANSLAALIASFKSTSSAAPSSRRRVTVTQG